ncbi:elongation factor P [Entomortierella parvispora]|uniref:Elongation factor P n=1 Tax=Entomortierella parvispora TaxID=205924 RepID=A0A9P3LSQ7_9FUNG|nr:elongation factor P [Entomortierella parvispora]
MLRHSKNIFATLSRPCSSRSPLTPHFPAATLRTALPFTVQDRGFKTNVLQIRKGYVVEINNTLSVVLKRETSVMGRGTSTVKLEVQDLLTGTKHTERYRSGDMVEVTELDDHKCQFLYKNDGQLHLMDPETFEMYEVPESIMEDKQAQFLLPDMHVSLSVYRPDPDTPGTPISIKLPPQAIFEVKETHASAAQSNKGTVYKNADLDNGIRVQVPDFVNAGDKVVVDTETGKYVKRA